MALRFLGVTREADAIGKPITELVPQLGPVVMAALNDDRTEHHDQIQLMRAGRERTINVRVTTEGATGTGARLCHHPRRHHRSGHRPA